MDRREFLVYTVVLCTMTVVVGALVVWSLA